MGLNLANTVEAIAQAAGWNKVAADEAGVYRYFLEEGLDLEIRSPDGRLCVLSADMGQVPVEGDSDYLERITTLGKLSAGSLKKRASVLSVEAGKLQLTRTFDMATTSDEECVAQASDFLNDEAWWKANLDGNDLGRSSAASPFSLSGWFPGEMKF